MEHLLLVHHNNSIICIQNDEHESFDVSRIDGSIVAMACGSTHIAFLAGSAIVSWHHRAFEKSQKHKYAMFADVHITW
jgi:hypothetical protein